MRVIDPGHSYALAHLDGNLEELLTFVKREGPGYPGNVGSHPGTNIQEVLRACIDRLKYVDGQIHHMKNTYAIYGLRQVIRELEDRAAQRHDRYPPDMSGDVELLPTCPECGHIGCRDMRSAPETATASAEQNSAGQPDNRGVDPAKEKE